MLNFMEATGFVSSEDEFGVNADPLQTLSNADTCSLRHPPWHCFLMLGHLISMTTGKVKGG